MRDVVDLEKGRLARIVDLHLGRIMIDCMEDDIVHRMKFLLYLFTIDIVKCIQRQRLRRQCDVWNKIAWIAGTT